jgi:AbrB family looped-hinge helix DNA binding protein
MDCQQECQMTIQVNITPQGRMSLPADVRKRLGLTDGGAVFLEETADGVVLRTAAQAVARAQAIAMQFAESGGQVSVKGFLAHRKEDSGE